MIDSGLFVGTLRHRRFTPVAHAFTYPLFMVLLDIDRVPELMHVSAVTSYNRWNWGHFTTRSSRRSTPWEPSRTWDLYLGSCEATFLERHTGLFQLVLLKNGAQRVLFNDPGPKPAHGRVHSRSVSLRRERQDPSRQRANEPRTRAPRDLGVSARGAGALRRRPQARSVPGGITRTVRRLGARLPEVEAGLDAPRESMRLVQADGRIRLLTNKTARDHTTLHA